MIEKKFILIKIEANQAVLNDVDNNKKIFWPLEYLPKNIEINEPVNIIISSEENIANRKILARDVLNEILDISE